MKKAELANLTEAHQEALKGVWEHLDADRDGGVTASELKKAFATGDHSAADDPSFFADADGAAKQYLEFMDKNENKQIEVWEWLSFWDSMAGDGMDMETYIPQLKLSTGVGRAGMGTPKAHL